MGCRTGSIVRRPHVRHEFVCSLEIGQGWLQLCQVSKLKHSFHIHAQLNFFYYLLSSFIIAYLLRKSPFSLHFACISESAVGPRLLATASENCCVPCLSWSASARARSISQCRTCSNHSNLMHANPTKKGLCMYPPYIYNIYRPEKLKYCTLVNNDI